jgi:outer membrane receptor protein involved in Fe transport
VIQRIMTKAALIAFVCTASIAVNAYAIDRKPIEVPAGELATALRTLAAQAGVEFFYQSDLVIGLHTRGVSGVLSPEEAVTKLLEGTSLTLQMDSSGAMLIVRPTVGPGSKPTGTGEKAKPIANADLSDGPESVSEGAPKKSFWDRFRLAQTTSPSPTAAGRGASSSETSSEASSDSKLEEIVVTATKRAEKIQDVPLSIAAVTAEDIDRRGLVSAEDYLRGIPGVNQSSEQYGQSIVIRGIESSPSFQNAAAGTTVATYFGETPTTNSAGLTGNSSIDLKLVDIERVEVLRGPQGTAFGNSSLGGAVRTLPVAPKLDQFEGKIGVGYSITSGSGDDNNMIQGVANIPLIQDKLALRATAYRFEESGFYRNRAASDAAFVATMAPYGVEALEVDEDHVGAEEYTGGRVSGLFQATERLKFSLSYLTQKTQTDGFALSTIGTYDQAALQVAPEHVRRGQEGGLFDTDIDLTNATMEFDLGRADLLATYSYIESGSVWVRSVSTDIPLPISGRGVGDHRASSGEVRLTTRLGGAWDVLVGVYAEDLNDGRTVDYIGQGAFAGVIGGTSTDRRKLKQKAAFAEATWRFLPRFALTGGIRAYDYKRVDGLVSNGLFGDVDSRLASDRNGTIFRANLSYKPGDDALLYASWSQGFRLGTPQSGLPPGLCDTDGDGIVDGTTSISIDQTRRVDSDEVDNYEIGAKFALLDRRLQVSGDVFRLDWTGLPVLTYAPLPPMGCGQTYNANAGAARSEGVEVQANFQLSKALRIDAGTSWIRARLSKDAPALNPPAFEDDRLPGAPKMNANLGIQYGLAVGGHEAFVRADATYVGAFYGNTAELSTTKAGGYVKLDATARLTVQNLSFDLYARNLTNQDDFTFRGVADYGAFYGYRLRPRTFGVQLAYSFQ